MTFHEALKKLADEGEGAICQGGGYNEGVMQPINCTLECNSEGEIHVTNGKCYPAMLSEDWWYCPF